MAMTDNPLLLWDNKRPDTYSLITGAENSGLLFGEAQKWDCLRNYIVTTDSSGIVTIQLNYLAIPGIDKLVMGAHRHESSGWRFSGGSVQLQYWNGTAWTDCLATTAITALVDEPEIFDVAAHVVVLNAGYYSYRLTLSGFTAFTDIAIPEIFIGPSLSMPFVELGFDPSSEEWRGPSFESESGRVYETALSRRYAAKPVWNLIDSTMFDAINIFRESVIEERTPFWWFWSPATFPTIGYMMRHNGVSAPMPYTHQMYRSFSLNLIEAV